MATVLKTGKARGLVAVAAATVVAAAAIITAVVYRSGDEDLVPPAEVVAAYLRALAAGDADAALALGAATPRSTLLTDDVLKRQLEKLPITDVHVDGEQATPATNAERVYVKASASFGGTRSEGLIQVVRTSTSWKLASAFLNARTGAPRNNTHGMAFDTLTVFGQPATDGLVAMFPGALSVSTTTPFLDVTQPTPILLDRLRWGEQLNELNIVFSLNDAGKQATAAAVNAWLTACMTPGTPPAGPCDKIDQSLTMGGMALAGSARLTGPITLGQFTTTFDQSLQVAAIVNSANVPFVAQRPDGSTIAGNYGAFTTPVDLGENPPVVVAPGH